MNNLFIEVNKQIMEVRLLEIEFSDNDMTCKVLVNNGKDVMDNIKKLYVNKDMTTEFKISSLVDFHASVFNNTKHNLHAFLKINDADNTLNIYQPKNSEFHILDGMQVRTSKFIPVKKLFFDENRITAETNETLPFYNNLQELNYYNEREVVNYQDGSVSTIGGEHKIWDLDKDQAKAMEDFIKSYKKLRETGVALFRDFDDSIYALNSKGKSITDLESGDDDYSDIPEQAWIDLDTYINYLSEDGMVYKMNNSSVES